MATRKTSTSAARRKKEPQKPQYTCRDCVYSYDWSGRAYDGSLILCRCPYDDKSKNGKFCKFLKDPQCERFEKRATNGNKVE